MWQFIRGTEELEEGEVDGVVEMEIGESEGVEEGVRRAVRGLVGIMGEGIKQGMGEAEWEERIGEGIRAAREYAVRGKSKREEKKEREKLAREEKQGKKKKGEKGEGKVPRYFGILAEVDLRGVSTLR